MMSLGILHVQSASQVHGGLYAAGFSDGSVRVYDVRTPEMYVLRSVLYYLDQLHYLY